VGKRHSPALATSDASVWLRANLPTVADVVDAFAETFGRDGFKVTFAGEAGHVIGKPMPLPAFVVKGEDLFAHIPFRPDKGKK